MTPSTLLHPLKLEMATNFDFDEPTDYGVPISTVMRLLESGDL